MTEKTPQLENGYAKIANELLEQFAKINLSPYEWRVLWVVVRKTYGWNKKSDYISVSQIEEMTGMDRRNVSRAKKKLIDKNIIVSTDDSIGINKSHKSWTLSSKETIPTIVYRDTRPKNYDTKANCNLKGSRDQRCEWCQKVFQWHETENHHIVPKKCNGINKKENLARLCITCHKKAHREMEELGIVNSDDMQKWYRHFVSLLSSVQTMFLSSQETQKLSSQETLQKKDKNNLKKITKERTDCSGAKAPTADTWDAYSFAYKIRYKADPVRNATVNGQLANFIKRVGQEEAPHIAAFYLTHNGRYYVQKMHPVGLLCQDAEKLHTEWTTNQTMTETKARQTDKTQTTFNVFEKIKAKQNDKAN